MATDNGDPTDLVALPSKERKALNGLAMVIGRAKNNVKGIITVKAVAESLAVGEVNIKAK